MDFQLAVPLDGMLDFLESHLSDTGQIAIGTRLLPKFSALAMRESEVIAAADRLEMPAHSVWHGVEIVWSNRIANATRHGDGTPLDVVLGTISRERAGRVRRVRTQTCAWSGRRPRRSRERAGNRLAEQLRNVMWSTTTAGISVPRRSSSSCLKRQLRVVLDDELGTPGTGYAQARQARSRRPPRRSENSACCAQPDTTAPFDPPPGLRSPCAGWLGII